MIAIFKKEIRSYFVSGTGYIFLAVFTFFSGLFFSQTSLLYSNSDMRGMFNGLLTVLMFIVPVLTMRLWSEERRHKTEHSLLTLPVSVTSIVIGKFLAALTVFMLAITVTVMYVLITAFFGNTQFEMVLGNYLALVLLASVLVSIGFLVSSMTENQVAAAFLSFFGMYLMFSFGQLGNSVKNGQLRNLIRFFAIFERHKVFTQGEFSIVEVIYYLSFTAAFLFTTIIIIERKKRD